MVAKEFLDYLGQFNFVHASGVYDIFDRCVYILTFSIILVCSAVITVKSYILDPMSCYVATNVEGANNMVYINNYCWITGTMARSIHHGEHDNDNYWQSIEPQKIYYYQWVPLVLGLQAAILYLPYLFWESLIYNRLGTNLPYILDMAKKASLDFGENRMSKIQRVSFHIYTLLMSRKKKKLSLKFPRKFNFEIISFYILLKVVSFIVIVSQFILMENFLNMKGKHRFFGITLLQDIIRGNHWSNSNIFPRMGFCRVKFKINHSPGVNIMAQCSLSMNMLNEKIFIFLWWWFTLLASIQIIGLFLWIKRCLITKSRLDFVNKVMLVTNNSELYNNQLVKDFDQNVMALDGCFLMHMARLNCGDLVCYEVMEALLEIYKVEERKIVLSEDYNETMIKDSNKSLFV